MDVDTSPVLEVSPVTSGESLADIATDIACPNAREVCCQYVDEIYHFWVTLYRSKSLITRSEPNWQEQVVDVFRRIDDYIASKEGVPQLQRIGYVGLAMLMEEVKRVIALRRRHGGIRGKRGQRNASLALDLYLSALGAVPHRRHAKMQISRQLELGRRWQTLSTCCPLLSVTCVEKADIVIRRQTVESLHQLGCQIAKSYPKLTDNLRSLASIAEGAARTGGLYQDMDIALRDLKGALQETAM